MLRPKVHIRAEVENFQASADSVFAEFTIMDAGEKVVAQANSPMTIAAGQTQDVSADLTIANPHRWNGRSDPYLYNVTVTHFVPPPPIARYRPSIPFPSRWESALSPSIRKRAFFSTAIPIHFMASIAITGPAATRRWAISPEDELQDT